MALRFGRRDFGDALSSYQIDGQNILMKNHTKDLGVVIDEKLKFHQHVRTIVGRAGGLMGDLLRSTVCRSPHFMLTLFVTHIRPIIEYCSSVWNVGYMGDVRSVESLQRRWTREIDGMVGVDYEERLRVLDLFSVYGRLLRKDLIRIWKAFHAEENLGVFELFDLGVNPRVRGHSFRLRVPICRSELRRKSFAVRCVLKWNRLPSDVVECESYEEFKRKLDISMGEEFFKVI